MIKLFVATLFVVQSAFAGLPPTTLKGQKETSPTTTFNVQVPFFQATTLASGRRIETGNANRLVNPSFEAANPILGWTKAAGTSGVSTSPVDGVNSYDLAYTSINGSLLEQSVAISSNEATSLQTTNFEASIYVGVTSSNVQLCALVSGAEKACVSAPSGGPAVGLRKVSTYFTVTSVDTTMGLRLKTTTSDSASLRVDSGFVGVANLGSGYADSGWADAGPIVMSTTAGTVTKGTTNLDRFLWRRNGPNMEARIEYSQTTAGTVGSGTVLFGIPSSVGCAIDTTKITPYTQVDMVNTLLSGTVGGGNWSVGGTSNGGKGNVMVYSSSAVRIGGDTTGTPGYQQFIKNGFFGANEVISYAAYFSVPCAGWVPQTAITSANSNFDNAPWMITSVPGWSTTVVSPTSCVYGRDNKYMTFECLMNLTGGANGTEPRVPLPAGLTTDGSYATATGEASPIGFWSLAQQTNGQDNYITCAQANKTYLNLCLQRLNLQNPGQYLTSYNGNGNHYITGRVKIKEWSQNANAPQLIGSVTLGGSSQKREIDFFARYFASGTPNSKCTASPCGFDSDSGNIASITRTGTGAYTLTPSAGTTCSGILVCGGAGADGVNGVGTMYSSSTTTAGNIQTIVSSSGAGDDTFGNIWCKCTP